MPRDHYGRMNGEHWNGYRLASEKRARERGIQREIAQRIAAQKPGPVTPFVEGLLPGQRESDYRFPLGYWPTQREYEKRAALVAELKAKGVICG